MSVILWSFLFMLSASGVVSSSSTSTSIILPPDPDSTSPEVAVILIPGDLFVPEDYLSLVQELQSRPAHSTWVGVVADFNSTDIVASKDAVVSTINSMADEGMVTKHLVLWIHSLSKSAVHWLTDWIEAETSIKGVVLLGCQTEVGFFGNTDLPTMVLQGDLDGIVPVTASMHLIEELESLVDHDDIYKIINPVVVLRDLNHAGYLDDKNQALDIKSPLNPDDLRQLVAEQVSLFLVIISRTPEDLLGQAEENFVDNYDKTLDFYQPLKAIMLVTIDGSKSLWAEIGQEIISAVRDEYLNKILITNSVLDISQVFSHQPEIEESEGRANISILTAIKEANDGHYTHQEIIAKYKSRDAVQEVLLPFGVEFLNTTTCKDVNQEAIYTALIHASEETKERFETRGRPFLLQEDDSKITGSGWVGSEVIYNDTLQGLEIQSTSLITGVNVGFGLGGMNYCKLLPPSRAMEYIMVDSLRFTEPPPPPLDTR